MYNLTKVLAVFTFILIFASSGIAQTNSEKINLTNEEERWVEAHPVVTATNNMDLPPFDFVSEGKSMGFAIDYLNLVAEKVGINIEYVNNKSWDELISQVRIQEIDIVHSLVQNPERDDFLHFTETYIEIPIVNFGRVGSNRINNIHDLEDKKIGVIKGWATTDFYRKNHPEFTLIEYTELKDALQGLSSREIDVLTGSQITLKYFIAQNFMNDIEVIGDDFVFETNNVIQQRLATRKGLPILRDILQKGMNAVTRSEYEIISNKWQTGYRTQDDFNIGLTKEELSWLSSHTVIKVGANYDVKPVEYVDRDGTIKGIAGDYLDEISKLVGIKFEWAGNKTWEEAITLAKNGEIKLLSAVVHTEERESYLDFTDSYMTIANMIFTRTGSAIYQNLESLEGLSISAEAGGVNLENIKLNHPGITVIEVNTTVEAIKLVSIGAADAFIGGLPSTSFYMAEQSITNLIAVGETPYISKLSMGVPKGDPLLVSILNKAIRSISQKRKSEIISSWYSLKIENKPNYDLIIKLSIAGSLLLIFILYWNNRLRKEVLYRKQVEEKLIISRQKTEEESAAKSTFLANMSHELRTPLNAIIGFSDAMITGVAGQISNPKQIEYLHDIKNSGNHLAIVIKDILDLSKIEAGKWPIKKDAFLLIDCVESAIKMLSTQAQEKNIIIGHSVEPTLSLIGDKHAMIRILLNLISNSVKFSHDSGKINCDVELDINGVMIMIKDNGIGIPADRIEQVVKPFEQASFGHELNEEGTGLGLPIVKRLVELHDGELTLVSEHKVGTCVTIRFPNSRIMEH